METIALAIMIPLVAALARYAWKRWGKKAIDDPKTPEDESDIFDPVVDAAVEAFVKALATKETGEGKTPTVQGLARAASVKFRLPFGVAERKVRKILGIKF